MLSWVNGAPGQAVPARDRGLAYGDGLFETIAVREGRLLRIDRHLARLGAGCRRLAMPVDLALIEAELRAFACELGDGVAKLTLTRGEGQRGYAPPQPCEPMRVLLGSPAPHYPAAHAEAGVELFPCQTRLSHQPLLAGLKHLNRLEQVLARAEWTDARYAEGLVCDVQGLVIEGVFSNLFIIHDGSLLTADLSRCGVAGVMRAELLERAAEHGVPVQVCDLSLERLHSADEVFVCNSQYGIWPVRRVVDQQWPVGPITRQLQRWIELPGV